MTNPDPARTAALTVGQRVSRKNGNEQGTILEIEDRIKVKWDGGRISYFFRDLEGDVVPIGSKE